jgi:protein-tyrosine phosphatase
MNLNRILPHLVVGSCPERTEDVDCLKDEFGVTAVLNLHSDEDLVHLNLPWDAIQDRYSDSAIEFIRVPVRDYDRADLRRNLPRCVEALRQLLEDGHTVYVHCTAGIGRSPSVAVAYLHWIEHLKLEEAIRRVKEARPCVSPEADAIRRARGARSAFRPGRHHDSRRRAST